jgi:lauroyl/myristoyl acyltransferase
MKREREKILKQQWQFMGMLAVGFALNRFRSIVACLSHKFTKFVQNEFRKITDFAPVPEFGDEFSQNS